MKIALNNYNIIYIVFLLFFGYPVYGQQKGEITIVQSAGASPRVQFGLEKLKASLKTAGYQVVLNDKAAKGANIVLRIMNTGHLIAEGYTIDKVTNTISVTGLDASGVLYGCLRLAEEIATTKKLPENISINDAPEMVMRGTCIGLQKPYYLPGRTVYEYPYTPQTFPWFYDKKLWIQVLDSMVENRMNSLYLWNGHPFASLVRLKDYPYAVEVDDATFKKNEEMYRFITTEADKRGIWVIQMFYNIIVSKPFAEKNKIKTQDRERPIIPLIADYTRKSIAAFVEKYPNVGLMVCLGEAMEGTGNDDIEWFTKTIIPGVQDGLKRLGKKDEPPIVLRAHDTDAPAVMKAALPLYKNLYTEAKFNGEALTYARPRGEWAKLHQTLSKLGSVQIENVHILANLEPFRYGSPDFIQQSVIGMHEVMGGNGLHLYPQASYWDWPYSADSIKGGKRLLQIERDWIWYKAWARYAWKAKRNRDDERKYWSNLLANKFGCSEVDGPRILDTYELTGEIAPKLLRRFGITDGNRQTLTLGMLMTQLINPYRYGLFTLLYDSEAPEGEMLVDWVDKDVKGQPHIGETPTQVRSEVMYNARKATSVIDSVGKINKEVDEYLRWRMDVYLYYVLAHFFDAKIEAANYVLRYKYKQDIELLEYAYRYLNLSVQSYREFASMTAGSYLYANSMQTQQRKIPMRGAGGTYKHWTEMLPVYENELKIFRKKIDSLKNNTGNAKKEIITFKDAGIATPGSKFKIEKGANIFTDTNFVVKDYAPELRELNGLQFSFKQQMRYGTELKFSSDKPVKILVGYFKTQRAAFTTDTVFSKAPELETNASADDYGQAEIKISNAIAIEGLPPVNIHVYSFKEGKHELKLPKGVCLVLGFIDGQQVVPAYDAMLMSDNKNKNLDWLFE
jgi:hypothetical protein